MFSLHSLLYRVSLTHYFIENVITVWIRNRQNRFAAKWRSWFPQPTTSVNPIVTCNGLVSWRRLRQRRFTSIRAAIHDARECCVSFGQLSSRSTRISEHRWQKFTWKLWHVGSNRSKDLTSNNFLWYNYLCFSTGIEMGPKSYFKFRWWPLVGDHFWRIRWWIHNTFVISQSSRYRYSKGKGNYSTNDGCHYFVKLRSIANNFRPCANIDWLFYYKLHPQDCSINLSANQRVPFATGQ